ncbi:MULTISPECIES: LacI family DNA-binding transcriptional regulator [Arthrobacter]|uniref:LacI family DNA-binding transcriptional regulator n=2 Tax=Arthrobacter TaxID=1663 RepID=A0ABU9KKA7_9MICC|nr:LacI family DNA-binding transcriptional regulator [Arthrobacter sp. YJM1]MDP5226434.1 LacI family DNA-binding transcriptional regulator [Arthrobacter sp. YJM1]
MAARAARGGHHGVSIEDVAEAAGVSTATVSRAVRGLPRVSETTRQRILQVAAELGYVASSAASGLATGRTRTIGVLAPYVDRWFFYKALEGVERELHQEGYNLSLFSLDSRTRERQRTFTKTMVAKHIDALLVLCMALSMEEIDELRRLDIPLVAVGGPVEGCPSVGIDDVKAAALATRHLLELGHRDIGILHGQDDDDDLNFKVPALRVDGFRAELERHGVPFRPEWEVNGNFTLASGAEAFDELWARPGPKPSALMCASDEMAMGVVLQARRHGVRVPEDLSVIGIDDHEFSSVMGLTTVGQDPVDQARSGTRMLLDELTGKTGAVRDVGAGFELILRSTTAAPAAR